ncbi:hypothetical protein T08_10160 [Trichinella sp. T8]|nr:hypothetical protein T08_15961 [Trichinella sp. T8]KRZ82307.1 hypothetical protein T08_10160 [Trichinella sp. T8]
MTYRFTISDIEEVALSNFLTDDLHIDHYEDDILKSRSSSWKWNNMILPLVNCRLLLNCICSPEYLLQLNAEYAADADSQRDMSNTNDDEVVCLRPFSLLNGHKHHRLVAANASY